jgi:anti-sigma factor RsiW
MTGHDPSTRERARALMMAAIDDECSPAERRELEELAGRDPALGAEWAAMTRVKEATTTMMLRQPAEETWDRYWMSVYNRTERKVAWLLVGFGILVLIAWSLWHAVPAIAESLLGATDIPLVVRAAVVALLTGSALLIVSVVREQLSTRRSDTYDKGVSR